MNNLSYNRIVLLLQRYFRENWKIDLIIAAIVFGFDTLSSLNQGSSSISIFMIIVLLAIYSGRMFAILGRPQGAMNYLMLPASPLEKVLTGILLSGLYFPIVIFASSLLGIMASIPICAMIYNSGLVMKSINFLPNVEFSPKIIIAVALFILMINSIMMFGSVYFKRKAVIKTMLCLLAFNFAVTVIGLILGWIIYKRNFMLLGIEDPSYTYNIVCIAMAIITVFFWVLSYFRLKETEA
ncbi:MAG: hypothetical protein J6W06_10825 [Bacteroidales bacterium]|nr:hypothetical protein [Bacteroidales bacterium]